MRFKSSVVLLVGLFALSEGTLSPRLQLASICDVQGVNPTKVFLSEAVTMPDEVVTRLVDVAESNCEFAKSVALNYVSNPRTRPCYRAQDSLRDIHLCIHDKMGVEVTLLRILNDLAYHEVWMSFAPVSDEKLTRAHFTASFGKALRDLENGITKLTNPNLLHYLLADWNGKYPAMAVDPYREDLLGEEAFELFMSFAQDYAVDDVISTDASEKVMLLVRGALDPAWAVLADVLKDYPQVIASIRLPYKQKVDSFSHFLLLALAHMLPTKQQDETLKAIEQHEIVAKLIPLDSLRKILDLYSGDIHSEDSQTAILETFETEIVPAILQDEPARQEYLKAFAKYYEMPLELIQGTDVQSVQQVKDIKIRDILESVAALPQGIASVLDVGEYLWSSNWIALKPVFEYYAPYVALYGKVLPSHHLPKDPQDIASKIIEYYLRVDVESILGSLVLTTAFGRERKLLFRQFIDLCLQRAAGSLDALVNHLLLTGNGKIFRYALPLLPDEVTPSDEPTLRNLANQSLADRSRFLTDLKHLLLIGDVDIVDDENGFSSLFPQVALGVLRKLASHGLLAPIQYTFNSGNFYSLNGVFVEGLRHAQTHPKAARWLLNHWNIFDGNLLSLRHPTFYQQLNVLLKVSHQICANKVSHRVETALWPEILKHVQGEQVAAYLETFSSMDDIDSFEITRNNSCRVVNIILNSEAVSEVIPWATVYANVLSQFPGLEHLAMPFVDELQSIRAMAMYLGSVYDSRANQLFTTYVSYNHMPKDTDASHSDICPVCQEEYTVTGGDGDGVSQLNACKHHFHQHCAMSTYQTQEGCPMCRMPFFPQH